MSMLPRFTGMVTNRNLLFGEWDINVKCQKINDDDDDDDDDNDEEHDDDDDDDDDADDDDDDDDDDEHDDDELNTVQLCQHFSLFHPLL